MQMDTRYNHELFDREIRELWEQNKVYGFSQEANKPVFSIDTPPPTVSGTLHIGHVFSYTHTDIIARYKRLRGFSVFYPMGYDDNGLATERFVEKKNNTKAHLLKRSEFIALCEKEAAEAEIGFKALWQDMGLSVDWESVYTTISSPVQKISQYSFIDLYKKGLAYRRAEPSLYCTTCQTAVAQAELDTAEVKSTFNDVEFKLESGETFVVATTRPELLPAVTAVLFHPNDDRYKHFIGKKAIVPLFGHAVPMLADEKVDPEKGSGIVMCATFGDTSDIAWFKKHQLQLRQAVGRDGKWTALTGPLEGMRVHEARKKVLELLQQEGLLKKQMPLAHNVATHERCKQEIEYLVLSQWFIKILEHKETFLALADQIAWRPEFMKARYKDWVKNLNWDWCISRQRYFGIPFPVWHCGDCQAVLLADEQHLPIDPQETRYPGGKCLQCSSSNIHADTDVMDTWNTSSLTPQINQNWPEGNGKFSMPMSMRPQAHDIIRTWAFYTIIKAYYHNQQIPWESIMISGHVLAGKEKISKSLGNEKMTPHGLLQAYSPDVVRYWTASGKLGADTAYSENQLKIGQRLVTKLWNALRFCADFIRQGKAAEAVVVSDALNQWLLHSFNQTVQGYHKHMDAYEYCEALELVERFFWHDFCDNYLEMIKNSIMKPELYSEQELQAIQYVVYEVCFGLLQLYAPYIPYVTDKLYQLLFKSSEHSVSLHNSLLVASRYEADYPASVLAMEKVMNIVSQVRRAKSELHVSLKTPVTKLLVALADASLITILSEQKKVLQGVTQAQDIVFEVHAALQFSAEGSEEGVVVTVPVQ